MEEEEKRAKHREYVRRAKQKMRADPERRKAEQDRRKELRYMKHGAPYPMCEVCGADCKTFLDHDHITGYARGWLCNPCNTALGAVKDNTSILRRMISYLERMKRREEAGINLHKKRR